MSSNKTSRHADRDASGERSTSGVTSGATSVGRRGFLRAGVLAAAGLALSRPLLAEPVMAAARMTGSRGPDDEMIEAVRQLLKSKFGDRKIQYGHVQLDIPTDAPDGRAVPAIMDIDLPITRDSYVSAYYLMVDHNPDILPGHVPSDGGQRRRADRNAHQDAADVVCPRDRGDEHGRGLDGGHQGVRRPQRLRLSSGERPCHPCTTRSRRTRRR